MIEFQHEHLLTLSAAAREVPGRQSGRGVNCSTVWRWVLRGIRGVRLETVMIGGVRHTSREALQRFFEETTAVANGKPRPTTSSRRQQRAIEEAERFLESELHSRRKSRSSAKQGRASDHG